MPRCDTPPHEKGEWSSDGRRGEGRGSGSGSWGRRTQGGKQQRMPDAGDRLAATTSVDATGERVARLAAAASWGCSPGPSPVAVIMARAGSSIGSDRSDDCIPGSGSSDGNESSWGSESSDRSDDCSSDNGGSQSNGSSCTRHHDNDGRYGNSGIRKGQSLPIPVAVITASTGSSIGSHRSDSCIHEGGCGDGDEGSWSGKHSDRSDDCCGDNGDSDCGGSMVGGLTP